jgi:hypothetical protein
MQFSEQTLAILKNFSIIKMSLIFRPGTQQRTISTGQSVLATATIAEDIPREFAIYDVPELLRILTLFHDPDVQFDGTHLTISSGSSRVTYPCVDPAVVQDPLRTFSMPEEFLSFVMSAEALEELNRATAALKATQIEVAYSQQRSGVSVSALMHVNDPLHKRYTVELEPFTVRDGNLESCRLIFSHKCLTLLPGEYRISLGIRGDKVVGQFENQTTPVTYYVGAEPRASTVQIRTPATV